MNIRSIKFTITIPAAEHIKRTLFSPWSARYWFAQCFLIKLNILFYCCLFHCFSLRVFIIFSIAFVDLNQKDRLHMQPTWYGTAWYTICGFCHWTKEQTRIAAYIVRRQFHSGNTNRKWIKRNLFKLQCKNGIFFFLFPILFAIVSIFLTYSLFRSFRMDFVTDFYSLYEKWILSMKELFQPNEHLACNIKEKIS